MTCETGTRSRIGRCCSPSCSKVVTETEACDTGIPCEEEEGRKMSTTKGLGAHGVHDVVMTSSNVNST